MKPDCSIVIRAYNEEKMIERLLTGIFQQTVKNIQVILVDSGSTDATLEIARKFPVEVVKIQPHEFTFGRSLNKGISEAQSELVVIASAHVYPVYPDWLEKILAPFQEPRVALTYGKQRGSETTQFAEQQIFQHWFPEHVQTKQKHPFCNNANAAVRRSLWETHSYDENLPALEDLAWARWAQESNYEIIYVPDAEVIHVHHESLGGIYNRYKREGMAFKQIYPQENFGVKDLVFLWVGNSFNDVQAAAQQKKGFSTFLPILRFRWKQFWGTYQGYRQSGMLTWDLKRTFYYPRLTEPNQFHPKPMERQPIRYQDQHSSRPMPPETEKK
jgi:rhamnosyltransferase